MRARDVSPCSIGLTYVLLHIYFTANSDQSSVYEHAAFGAPQDRKGAKPKGFDGHEADVMLDGTLDGGADGNIVNGDMGRGPSAAATGSAPPEPLDRTTRRRQRQAERDAADALKRRQRARRCALHGNIALCKYSGWRDQRKRLG